MKRFWLEENEPNYRYQIQCRIYTMSQHNCHLPLQMNTAMLLLLLLLCYYRLKKSIAEYTALMVSLIWLSILLACGKLALVDTLFCIFFRIKKKKQNVLLSLIPREWWNPLCSHFNMLDLSASLAFDFDDVVWTIAWP